MQSVTELMRYGAAALDLINSAVCTLGTLNYSLLLLNIPHRGVDFSPKTWIVIAFFVNIGVNNLRKPPSCS